jgi:predicted  nucleic acid-binding Zn-ribbon protein
MLITAPANIKALVISRRKLSETRNEAMEALITVPPQVDPRVRMKEIRTLVKDHVSGKNRANVDYLGQLKLAPEDMTRMVIALQDMLTKEREKHKRCREHLLDSQDENRELSQIVGQLAIDSIQMQRQLESGSSVMEAAEKHINVTTAEMVQAATERDAVLLTMRLLSNQEIG